MDTCSSLRMYGLVVAVLLLAACGGSDPGMKDKDEPAKPGTGTGSTDGKATGTTDGKITADGGDPGTADKSERVLVIEIVEDNTDELPPRLVEFDDDELEIPPFQVMYGHLVVHREKPDASALAGDSLTLDGKGTPVSKCKVFVVHAIRYAGKGRTSTDARYYAFAELPASIPLPAAPPGDAFEHEPVKGGPLVGALLGIRLPPGGAKAIELKQDKVGNLEATIGAQTLKPLAAGQSAELPKVARTIHVTDKGVVTDAVTESDDLFDPAPPKAPGPKRVISPPQDFGKVVFSTQFKIVFHGAFPLTTTPPKPNLED